MDGESTWGDVEVEGNAAGNKAAAQPPAGKIELTVKGQTLRLDWDSLLSPREWFTPHGTQSSDELGPNDV